MYSNKLICDILIYINENLTNRITTSELQDKFYYNKFYIVKLFKKEIGMTIIQYINSLRIYNSILQIKNTNNSLINIAIRNGFTSLEYFSETFKQITGLNPKVFRDYFFNKKYISDKDLDLINAALVNLYNIKNIKDIYLSRQKPIIMPNKKLSIFR
ncbi:MAG: helix-turn-helix transcriptional regulator [Bacilli bacterium]